MVDARTSERPRRTSVRQVKADKVGDRLPIDAWIAATLAVVALAWFKLANHYGKEPPRLWLAIGIVGIGVAPLLFWMRNRQRGRLPVFHLHCVFYAFVCGFTGFFEDTSTLKTTVEEDFMRAAQWATLLGLAGLFVGFHSAGRMVGTRLGPARAPIPLAQADLGWVALGLYPVVFGISIGTRMLQIPYLNQSLQGLRDFLFMFLTVGFVAGALGTVSRLLYLVLYVPALLLVGFAGGNISTPMVPALLICTLYMSFRRRVPWVSLAIIATCFVILQPVKYTYREIAWTQGAKFGLVEGTKLFFSLGLEELFGQKPGAAARAGEALEMTIARMNHLHVTGAVIRDTPALEPFQNGLTYLPLLTKWIPRAIWKNKPKETLGNDWARPYGYLGEEDFGTSFNLPWLTEMYLNFGWLGVFWINLAVGFGFRLLHLLLLDRPFGLAGAAFGMTITSCLILAESNLSLLVGRWAISMISLMAFAVILRFVRRARSQEPLASGGKRRVSNAPRTFGRDERGLVSRSQRMR